MAHVRCKQYGNLTDKGFTLVELILVTAMFVTVLIIAAQSFNTLLVQSNLLAKSDESNIEGVIGLEIMRHDLEQAGFGLPWNFDPVYPPNYSEAADSLPSSYNDTPNVPRAIASGAHVVFGNMTTDYFAIKATTVARNTASQRWTYLSYSSARKPPRQWSTGNVPSGSRVTMLRRTFLNGSYSNQLVTDTSGTFFTTYPTTLTGTFSSSFSPRTPFELYYVYGVDKDNDLRMPFNRTDYFVSRTANPADTIPSACAPGTGILYKSTVNHSDGQLSFVPIMDCVASMRVVFGWDMDNPSGDTGNGTIGTYSSAFSDDGINLTVASTQGATVADIQSAMADPAKIRNRLKLIKVYILAQEGGQDPHFRNTITQYTMGDPSDGVSAKIFSLTPAMMNYRFKLYRVVARPKNLVSN